MKSLESSHSISPDKWVILKISHLDKMTIKILSGWSGGYLYGSSWRLSSHIIKFTEDDKYFIVETDSGSLYTLNKTRIGFNTMSSDIYDSMINDFKNIKDADCQLFDSIELVQQVLTTLNNTI